MMFRNTLRRGLTITLLGLALATPLTQAAEPVSLTLYNGCLLYTSPSPRDRTRSRMPSSA